MKIILPEAAKGFKFELLYTIDMNAFDVEMLLPMLFHMVRTKGNAVGKANDPQKFDEYFQRMQQHDRIKGFDGFRTRTLLRRWLRTSVVKIGHVGRGNRGEQILYVTPRTLLAYKGGWPKEVARLRGTHRFLYLILLEESNKDPVHLEHLFTESFGQGVVFGLGPQYDGKYDGESELDIETLLSLCFLDQLSPAGVGRRPVSEGKSGPRLVTQSKLFAQDVLALLRCYRDELSTGLLLGMLAGLINMHLFVYTMRLMRWVLGVVRQEPAARHKVYVDCTGERQSYSGELARACVESDLGELETYMRAALRLRTLDRYIRSSARLKPQLPLADLNPGEYLRKLVELQNAPEVENKSELEFDEVLRLNQPNSEEDQITDAAQFIESLATQEFACSLDRIMEVLVNAHRRSVLDNLGGWYYSVAGFNKPYGLMSGNARGVRVARYTLSNELLSILVHVALATAGDGSRPATRMPLRQFLHVLEERYGILIDKPPSFDASVEASEAARRNVAAFKTRLRQIGVFRSLSDDFGAQYIQRPVSKKAAAAC